MREEKNVGGGKESIEMPQTAAGAANSSWILFMRECAAQYHAWKAAEAAKKGGDGLQNPPRGKVAGKAKPEKVMKPVTVTRAVVPAPVEAASCSCDHAKYASQTPPRRKLVGKQAPMGG